mgnify:CR=1 FL=1
MAVKSQKSNRSSGKDKRRQDSRTRLLEFSAQQDFRYCPNNASAKAEQIGKGGGRFLTSAQNFANQVLVTSPEQFRIRDDKVEVSCLARDQWARTRFAKRKILFLLPSQALGNNVCTMLFFQAFIEQHQPREVGVFCAQSASDIYLRGGNVTVHALWLSRKELRRWDMVIDLGHLESRRNIEFWPVDMEADLLDAFELAPSARYTGEAAPMNSDRPPRIGIFPLASSPLRTLPVETTVAMLGALQDKGPITLCLNRFQRQGQLYSRALKSTYSAQLPPSMKTIEAFSSIGDLLDMVAACDYLIAADSGPAHMAKLSAIPGVAVYSSAPGDILQGRFKNLARWTVPFAGDYCTAPCGLAGARQTSDGRIGCMGSLQLRVEDLPDAPRQQQANAVDQLFANPVPCIRHLAEDPASLVDFILHDLAGREL